MFYVITRRGNWVENKMRITEIREANKKGRRQCDRQRTKS